MLRRFHLGALAADSLLVWLAIRSPAQAVSIPVLNHDFEITPCVGFCGPEPPLPGPVPGWTVEPLGADAGLEFGGNPGFALFVAGQGPTVYQATAHNILADTDYRLMFDAKDAYTSTAGFGSISDSAVLNVWLYFGTNRTPLATAADLLLPNRQVGIPYTTFSITVAAASIPDAAIGQSIGIEFDNVSDERDLVADVVHSWIHVDNVRLFTIGGLGNSCGVTPSDCYGAIRDHFRQTVATRGEGDLTGDGFVDLRDFREWKDNFPLEGGPLQGNGTPEPSCWILLLSSAALFMSHRSQREYIIA
jgi:hypothetical protein